MVPLNPEKLQGIMVNKKRRNNNPTESNIDGKNLILKAVFYY